MEIGSLETKSRANRGAFLHLKHPALGHRLWTGEGADEEGRVTDQEKAEKVGVWVVGLESERVRERAKALQKSAMKEEDGADEAGLEFVCGLVTEFHGLTKDGKPLPATDQAKREFFQQSDAFVEQVTEFASDRANFWSAA